MRCFSSPAILVIVHRRQIVMHQRIGMHHLDRRQKRLYLSAAASEQFISLFHQHGPQPLSACQYGIIHCSKHCFLKSCFFWQITLYYVLHPSGSLFCLFLKIHPVHHFRLISVLFFPLCQEKRCRTAAAPFPRCKPQKPPPEKYPPLPAALSLLPTGRMHLPMSVAFSTYHLFLPFHSGIHSAVFHLDRQKLTWADLLRIPHRPSLFVCHPGKALTELIQRRKPPQLFQIQ